ncbi:MAG: Na+/H+ antiporter NhaC family protein [Lawsonibacter sp.]|nr:Na+/H+ antiporter NhaC family protein [Lawsonibacter sp.]
MQGQQGPLEGYDDSVRSPARVNEGKAMCAVDLLIAFLAFLSAVTACMVMRQSLAWALLVGFVCFFLVGLRRGFSAKSLIAMAGKGAKTSLMVQRIMVLIGLLTALWRASGTIAFFVHTGTRLITPHSFVLVAFLLPAILCLAFGSSFGVAGTAGVILMSIARGGGANLAVTAGAVMSGAYVGERLSPASSAAALVAAVSGVDQRGLQRRMWRTTLLPMVISLLVYGALSQAFPIQLVDIQILMALQEEFRLNWPAVLPALALIVLPWFRVSASWSIAASCTLAGLVAVLVQGIQPGELMRVCVLGYAARQPELAGILSGGGLISMISVVVIVFLSCSYSGLFAGTGMLVPYQEKAGKLADQIGLIPTQILLALCCAGLFCNQSVTTVMVSELMKEHYRERGLPAMDFAVDLGDTALNLPGMIPWCIACSVPLTTIGSGMEALPFAVYLYLVPLCRWLTSVVGGNVGLLHRAVR